MASKPADKLPPNPAKPAAARTKAAEAPARRYVDWEAVERDYRTGKYTLRELEAQHGISYAEISRRSKKQGWTKDLRQIIRQATDAALLQESVTNAQKAVTETVVVAAEVNKHVILGHRADAKDVRSAAQDLLAELTSVKMLAEEQDLLTQIIAGEGAESVDVAKARAAVRKALDVHTRINSVKTLAEAFTKAHAMERQAYDLDNAPPQQDDALKALLHGIASGNSNSLKPVREDPDHQGE